MKVILQHDVKDLGKVGEIVRVKEGYARNFLFPRRLAVVATEGRVKEFEHLQRVAEARQKKAVEARKGVVDKVNGLTLTFKVQAGEGDKLYGSVTPLEISNELETQGFSIDKRDIHIEDAIKVLGQHRATIKLGPEQEAEIVVAVERA